MRRRKRRRRRRQNKLKQNSQLRLLPNEVFVISDSNTVFGYFIGLSCFLPLLVYSKVQSKRS
jgi:hypothetical protein